MRGSQVISALLVLVMFGAGAWYWREAGYPLPAISIPLGTRIDSQAAFDRWLAEAPERGAQFAALEDFLRESGVHGVVPAWQLARVDAFYAQRCDSPAFTIPPHETWGSIVPALQLVRDHVVPSMGEVSVLSSYRTPEINACAHGASGSNHLDFAALDLATVPRRRGADLYREVCAMQREAGAESRMGLGAYFNPAEPEAASGRFHIDAEGFRTWGWDYSSRSNPCPALGDENERGDI